MIDTILADRYGAMRNSPCPGGYLHRAYPGQECAKRDCDRCLDELFGEMYQAGIEAAARVCEEETRRNCYGPAYSSGARVCEGRVRALLPATPPSEDKP